MATKTPDAPSVTSAQYDAASPQGDPRDAELIELRRQIADLKAGHQSAAFVNLPTKEPVTLETRKLYFTDGSYHVCGRTGNPTVFQATPDDRRPHAFVHQSLGDHLIDCEQRKDGSPRYAWADE